MKLDDVSRVGSTTSRRVRNFPPGAHPYSSASLRPEMSVGQVLAPHVR